MDLVNSLTSILDLLFYTLCYFDPCPGFSVAGQEGTKLQRVVASSNHPLLAQAGQDLGGPVPFSSGTLQI